MKLVSFSFLKRITDPDVLKVPVLCLFLVAIAMTYFRGAETRRDERSDRRSREQQDEIASAISRKMKEAIPLDIDDVRAIARGVGASESQGIAALYSLFATVSGKNEHDTLKRMIADFDAQEPFEAYPAEVRPSLYRIAAMCEESPAESDKQLLNPLTKILSEYQDLKAEEAYMRTRSKLAFWWTVVGVALTILGVLLAFKGPSKSFIATELAKAKNEIIRARTVSS